MFEAQLAYYLNRYLGTYVQGLDTKSLKISVFKGDVTLRNLKLKPEALADLNLPITVKAGLIGSLTLKVPWTNLGKSAVLVYIDRLYILAGPKTDPTKDEDGDYEAEALEREAKRQRVESAELASMRKKEDAKAGGGGMFKGLIDTIIGNLQLSISNVHIRYEDDVSYPGAPFAVGLTLEALSAHTVDESGKEAFVTQNPVNLLRKASELRRLALYFDVGTKMWQPEEDWQQLSPDAWDALFRPGIAAPQEDEGGGSEVESGQTASPEDGGLKIVPRSYVLKPIDGRLLYKRRGKDVRESEEQAIQEADITLQSISLHLSKGQYQSLQKLLETFSSYSARAPNRHLRPACRPDSPASARMWWQYAGAVARRQIRSQSFNWRQFERAIEYRKKYIAQYVKCLQEGSMGGDEAIAGMDAQLNEHTILTFRKLAHAKVELAKKREAAKAAAEARERKANQGWLSWAWGGSGAPAKKEGHEEEEDSDMRGELNAEEQEALEGLVSEQADALKDEKETPYSLRTQIFLSVQSASLVLDGPNKEQILRAGLEEMISSVQMFPSTLKLDLFVTAFGVLAPEGQLIRTGGHMHHSKSAVAMSDRSAVQQEEDPPAADKPKAMRLEYIQHPQDETSDAAVHFVLAPSYVTYNASTIQHVQEFFRTEEVMDFSALGAQAIAQVERAQRAARDQLVAAMNQRPKLSLKLDLEGPKIAVPVPAADGQGRLTLVVDLGSIQLESDTNLISTLPQEEAALYECLRLSSKDISAYVVDGEFSFTGLEAAGASAIAEAKDGTSAVTEAITAAVRDSGGKALGGRAVIIPLLERCRTETTVQIARMPHPTLPSLRAQLSVPRLRFFISAARVRRVLRVLRSALPEPSDASKAKNAVQHKAQEVQQWRADCEHSGTLRVLEWGGVTRTTAQWPKKWAAVRRGSLYLLDSEDSDAAPTVHNIWSSNRRIARVPQAVCGGVKNVLAVCNQDTQISKAAQQRDSLLLRFKTDEDADVWVKALHRTQQIMRELAGSDPTTVLDTDFDLSASEMDQSESASQATGQGEGSSAQKQGPGFSLRVAADLGEFSLFVSGRPADTWWPDEVGAPEGSSSDETTYASPPAALPTNLTNTREVVNADNERSLIVIRASGGSTDLSMGDGHFSTSLAVDAFEIEDLLVGPRCPRHAYLARSFVVTRVVDNEGDEFFDAGQEPSSPSFTARAPAQAGSAHSEELSFADASSSVSSRAGSFKDAPGPSELWEVSSTGGKAAETAPAKKDSAWILDFDSWAQGSSGYAGVDSEMRMRLKTLYFFANRPTIGALIALGSDFGAAFSSGKPKTAMVPAESADTPFAEAAGVQKQQSQAPSEAPEEADMSADLDTETASTLAPSTTFKSELGDSDSGNLVLEGGRDRVVFRLLMEVERLEATFNYESAAAPPLLLAAIEDVRFNVTVNPGTLVINASLGNMRAQDCVLPEGHPYRNVLDLRHGASTSLIELEFASHTGQDSDTDSTVPAGLPFYTLKAQLRELELVFLNRFLQEILRYISLLLAMQPLPLERPDFADDAAITPAEQKAGKPADKKRDQAGAGFLLLLDVEMDAPVITMPRSSDSQDFLEVDLGELKMTNRINWLFGTSPKDKKAVLLEEDTLVLSGLRAVVSAEGEHGENMIREDEAGFTVMLRRPVRDLRRQLPNIEVGISIPSIKATVSDREYRLITSVAGQNFGEDLRLPDAALQLEEVYRPEAFEDATEAERAGSGQTEQPSQALSSVSEATEEPTTQKMPSQPLRSRKQDRTTLRVVVNMGKSELDMLRTSNAATGALAPLARFTIQDLWVAFRSTESGAMHLSLSVPRVEGADLRPWVPQEHSLVISSARSHAASSTDAAKPGRGSSNVLDWDSASFLTLDMHTAAQMSVIKLQVRLQRPTISAEMSFLLAVMKFYIPDFAIASVTPIPFQTQDVLLSGAEYRATKDLWLSPQSRLLADSPEGADFVYDGQGHRLILPEGLHEGEALPLIIIGGGKSLQLKGVKLVHAASLPACIQLGSGAQLVCRDEDRVVRILGEDPEAGEDAAMSPSKRWTGAGQPIAGRSPSSARSRSLNKALSRNSRGFSTVSKRTGSGRLAKSGSLDGALKPKQMHLELELVAIGVGLQFVELEEGRKEKEALQTGKSQADLASLQSGGQPKTVRMLAAHLDLGVRYKMAGPQQRASAELRGLRIETRVTLGNQKGGEHLGSQVQGMVLEPCKVAVRMDMGGAAGDIQLTLSDLRMNLSPDVLELALSLQSSVLEPLVQPPPDRPLARTTTFMQVWSNHPQAVGPAGAILETNLLGFERGLTFWRPRPPIGYAALGDCVTTGTMQPTYQVVAVAVNSGLVTFPVSYSIAYKTSGLTIWMPKAPEGYTALGCVANPGDDPPALTEVACIATGIGVEAPLGSCMVLKEERSWRPSLGDGGHLTEKPHANVWCVENAGATFLVCSPESGSPDGPFLDLRSPLGVTPAALKASGQAALSQAPESSPGEKPKRGAQPGAKPSRELTIKGGPSTPAAKKAAESLAERPVTQRCYQEFQRSRAQLMRSATRRRAQSTAVDFRRVWWDKDRRAPSKTGMSIWRPLPPPGYVILGDCLQPGYDPPQSVVVLLDSELAEMEHTATPSVRMPRGFELVWKDEGDRADRCLSIWRPVPFPGYVAIGYVASRGESPPAKQSIRCVNARAATTVDLRATRPAVKLPQTSRRSGFNAWIGDNRLCTFVLSGPGQPPRQSELQRLRALDAREPRPGEGPIEVPKGGMNIVLKTGASSLLLRDALRRPLAEIELGEVDASLRKVDGNVTRAYIGVHTSAWSYNSLIQAWEPILEPWNLIMKADMNTGAMASHGVEPGAHISIKSTSELMRVTLAYAAAQSMFRALRQWRDLHTVGADEAYRRQLAAADAASVHTHVTNTLGVAAEMQLDFGDHIKTAELPPGETTPVLQPLPRPPQRHSQRLAVPISAQPPTLLMAHIEGVQGLAASLTGQLQEQGSAPEVYLSLSLQGDDLGSITAAADSWGARTRAVALPSSQEQRPSEASVAPASMPQGSSAAGAQQPPDSCPAELQDQGNLHLQPSSAASRNLDVRWNERLVLEVPPDAEEDEVAIEIELWDCAAEGGSGRRLAHASIALDLSDFEAFKAQSASIELTDRDQKMATVALQWALLPQHQADRSRTTDAWNAGPSTAGQRALRIGGAEDWAPVYSSAQTIAASSSQTLKKGSQNQDDVSASVIPVRLRGGVVAVESSFRGGMKHEVLRSLCQVANDTQLRLEVALVDAQRRPSARSLSSQTSGPRRSDSLKQEGAIEEEIFENERYLPIRGWGSRGGLLPTERRRYSTRDGSQSFNDFPTLHLPNGWEWEGPWEADEWAYAPDWSVMSYPPSASSRSRNLVDFVRRKRWVRRRRRQQTSPAKASEPLGRDLAVQRSVRSLAEAASAAQVEEQRQVLGVVEPGASLPVPQGWRSSGKQLVVRPVLEGFPDAHLWSIGATEGTQSIRLDTLDEGHTRLLACTPASPSRPDTGDASSAAARAKAARQSGEGGAAELASGSAWFSATIEAESLPRTSRSESITDWRIVIAAPLVLDNQLPHKGSFLIWERPKDGDNLILRQSGALASGERQHIYAADMRREVSLQFYPDGFEWLDNDPVPLSLGYSSHAAGVEGQQHLPDSFQVARATGSEAPQSVYVNRELDLDVWQLADKKLDPGAAVALGAPLLVRMFVPLWVVNATPLPVAAWVVPIQAPPPPSDREQGQSEGLMDAGESIRLKTLETESVQSSQGASRRSMPEGGRHVLAGSVSMVAYPMQQMAAFRRTEKRQSYGLRIKVGESGWTPPLPLESNANTEAPEDFNTKPVLIRARVPEWGTVHEITGRLELVGHGFERTLALRLEPYLVISNQTGIPLQLMQPRRGAVQQSFAGVAPSQATRDGLPRAGVPPAGRQSFGHGPPPQGLRSAISAQDADHTSTLDLPTGGAGIPLHWSLQADTRNVCLRFAPDSPGDAGPQWSHPLELEKSLSSTARYISLPVRPAAATPGTQAEAPLMDLGQEESAAASPGSSIGPKKRGSYLRDLTTLQTAAAPPWELHGLQARVGRRIKHYARKHEAGGLIEEIEVVVLRFRTELRAPGCMHVVLEAVSPRAPYLLENRSDQGLRYRQVGIADLPYLPLPPYSAAGFAWQRDASSGGIPSVELGASKRDAQAAVCCMLDPEMQPGAEDSSASAQKAAANQTLALSAGTELQMSVADREQEVMSAAGLASISGSGTVGHGVMERVLRIAPGSRTSRAMVPGGAAGLAAEQGGRNALYVRVDIGSLEVSIVDQRPEELIAAAALGVQVQYAAGLGPSGSASSLRASVESVQIDDDIPGTRFPVMLCPLAGENGGDGEAGGSAQPLVQITLVKQGGGARGQVYYPFISFRIARTLQFAVAEGLVWRAVEVYQHLDLGALSAPSEGQQVAAAADTPVQIALVTLTDLALAVSFRGDPFSRPRWASRMGALSWGLDLANFEGVPVRLHGFEMENVSMLWSAFVAQIFRQVRGQLIGVALSFLRNFGIFSGASGVLGALSRGVAAIGTDQAAQEERAAARQQREIGNVKEGLMEGGDALAQGFYRGFTGLVSKPLQGAKTGVGGFVKGLGQGLVGAAAQPVSGALDFMSSAFEGIDASSNTILGRLSNRPRAVKRRRLPRAIGGDRKLLPFVRSDGSDRMARIEAVGQVLMWKAVEAAPGLQRLGRRSRRPARAASDAYEEHLLLPDERVALMTNQRLMLIHAPGFAQVHAAAEEGVQIGNGDDIPAGQIRWSVEWQDLLAMELRATHRELPHPDRVIVHRKGVPGSEEEEHLARELRCFPNTAQAEELIVVASKVRSKYYREPQRESAMWARKHTPDLAAPLPGLGQQTLPATMPSIDFRLVWHTGRMADKGEIISVWRVVSPPGYGSLGDVVSLGLDPPTAPVTVYRNDADERKEGRPNTAHPTHFHLVFRENGRSPVTMWEPVAPAGYRALGTLVEGAPQMPDAAEVLCVREQLLQPTGYFDSAIWRWDPPGLQGGLNLQRVHQWDPQTWHCTIWPVDNAGSTFIAERGTRRPPASAALNPTIE